MRKCTVNDRLASRTVAILFAASLLLSAFGDDLAAQSGGYPWNGVVGGRPEAEQWQLDVYERFLIWNPNTYTYTSVYVLWNGGYPLENQYYTPPGSPPVYYYKRTGVIVLSGSRTFWMKYSRLIVPSGGFAYWQYEPSFSQFVTTP